MVESTQLAADNSTTHSSSDLPSSTSTQSDTQQPQIPAPSQDQSNQQEASRKQKKKWEPLSMPQPMQIMQEDIMNNCFVKGGLSCVMGGIAGFAFGLFSASLENAGAGPGDMSLDVHDKPTRVVLREMFNNMKTKSLSYAKGFAYFGALYSFNECVIEKYRAKHDKVNPALAGCATGAMMAYGGGPQAMCFGCVSVGAFSVAIEHFLDL